MSASSTATFLGRPLGLFVAISVAAILEDALFSFDVDFLAGLAFAVAFTFGGIAFFFDAFLSVLTAFATLVVLAALAGLTVLAALAGLAALAFTTASFTFFAAGFLAFLAAAALGLALEVCFLAIDAISYISLSVRICC